MGYETKGKGRLIFGVRSEHKDNWRNSKPKKEINEIVKTTKTKKRWRGTWEEKKHEGLDEAANKNQEKKEGKKKIRKMWKKYKKLRERRRLD